MQTLVLLTTIMLMEVQYLNYLSDPFNVSGRPTSSASAYTVVPPNTAVLGTGEKPAVSRNGRIGREYNLKKPYIFGLEMGGVLVSWRYWEVGGIGRAVLGGRRYVVVNQTFILSP